MELLEELSKPTSISHAVGHGVILSLGARVGDDVLVLGGSGDKVVAEKHNIARGGPTCIRATCPVSIHVDRQLRGGGASQVEAEVQGASQIAHGALHHSEVRLPGIMHMEADMLDGAGDDGAGECQLLEGPDEAPELSWISNRRLRSGRDLGLCVHGRQDQLAVHHASTLKDDESELMLSEEESIYLMLYRDPKNGEEG
jgi:hypothetical protein